MALNSFSVLQLTLNTNQPSSTVIHILYTKELFICVLYNTCVFSTFCNGVLPVIVCDKRMSIGMTVIVVNLFRS